MIGPPKGMTPWRHVNRRRTLTPRIASTENVTGGSPGRRQNRTDRGRRQLGRRGAAGGDRGVGGCGYMHHGTDQ